MFYAKKHHELLRI